MTKQGLLFVKARLMQCPNLDALRRYWEHQIGLEYKRHPEIVKLKDDMKKALE